MTGHRPAIHGRRWAWALLLAVSTGQAAWWWPEPSPAPAAPSAAPLRDLQVGEALYEVHRGHALGALALLSRVDESSSPDADRARLLRGAAYASMGMLRDAEQLLAEGVDVDMAPADAERTWLTLAQLHFRRGDAGESLRIIDARLDAARDHSAVGLLKALSLLGLGRKDDAAAVLKDLGTGAGMDAWSRYNLAVAHSQAGRDEAAIEGFRSLMFDTRIDEDVERLRDRAAYACAMHFFRKGDWREAQNYLHRIRLDSDVADPALLASGWAAFNADDKVGALTPWLTLSERPLSSPAVQEVLLNIPWVFEDQGALQDALDGYRRAEATLTGERERIEKARAVIASPDWLERISPPATVVDDPLGDLPAFRFQPDAASPWLTAFLASPAFLESWRDLREVQRLNQLLHHWQDTLPVYADVVADRRQEDAEQRTRLQKKAALASRFRTNVNDTRDRLVQAGERMLNPADPTASADAAQRSLHDRLMQLERRLATLPDAVYGPEKARLNRLKGLLRWEISQQAPQRQWQLASEQVKLERALAEFEQRFALLDQRAQQGPDELTRHDARVKAFMQRLTALRAQCQRALAHQRRHLRQLADNALTRQQIRLDQLRGYSLLSIARLQDQAFAVTRPGQPSPKARPTPAAPPVTMPSVTPPAKRAKSLFDFLSGSGE